VVEGTPYVREAIHALVDGLAHVVGLFANMHELATSDGEPADVILADFRCCLGPASDGWRDVQSRWPTASLILMTSEEHPDFDDVARSVGASGWVVRRHIARDLAAAFGRAVKPR